MSSFKASVLGTIIMSLITIGSIFFILHDYSRWISASAVSINPESKLPLLDKPYTRTLKFHSDRLLESMAYEDDAEWNAKVLPYNGGFLRVKTNDTDSTSTFTTEDWGITAFHGLHCLQILRSKLQANGYVPHTDSSKHRSMEENKASDTVHIGHCIRYLFQILTCNLDSTIEPPFHIPAAPITEHSSSGVTGDGYQHQCRGDLDQLWKFVQRSEHQPVPAWDWKQGETVEKKFGNNI